MLEAKVTHHIQKTILHSLLMSDVVRFSNLKPKELESNIFMYHLNQLIKQKLVIKKADGYSLTQDGKLYADRSNLASLKIRIQPKVITILTIKRADGQWLLLRRKHQPYINYLGFPSGKIHFGESLHQAAKRELKEKADIDGYDVQLRGNIVMRFADDTGGIVNHIIGYIFSAEVVNTDTITYDTEYYQAYWGPESDLFTDPSFQGHKEIIELLVNNPVGTLFSKEFDFTSDY